MGQIKEDLKQVHRTQDRLQKENSMIFNVLDSIVTNDPWADIKKLATQRENTTQQDHFSQKLDSENKNFNTPMGGGKTNESLKTKKKKEITNSSQNMEISSQNMEISI